MIDRTRTRAIGMLFTAVMACALALTSPTSAHAAWPLASRGAVLLGFGSSYQSREATEPSTHRGVDVGASRGDSVLAPLAGTVTFAGRVPAAGGGTVRAITLETDAGSLTLLPLGSFAVTKGAQVEAGHELGVVDSSGDPSTSEPHLHVGLRRRDVYVDPLSVMQFASPAPSPTAPVPDATPQGAPAAVKSGAAAPVAAAPGLLGAMSSAAAARAGGAAPSTSTRHARPAVGVTVLGGAPQPTAAAAGAGSLVAPVATDRTRAGGDSPAASRGSEAWAASLWRASRSAARLAGVAAATLLAGLGLLWPIWRRRREGSGEVDVSAVYDDVAAAVGR